MRLNFDVEGKVALVAASSAGLGFATAMGFAAEGAKVVLTSRSAEKLQAAKEQIVQATGNQEILTVVADVSKPEDIQTVYEETSARFGGVDVLITNAGGPAPGNFQKVTEADWETAFQLSLMSVVRLVHGALPHMKEKKWGRIVHFASSSVKQPIENLILSNTFRTAVAGLSKSLSIELASDGILSNVLGPGRIATDRVAFLDQGAAERSGLPLEEVVKRSQATIPLGRYGEPEEFARMAVFLGSGANGYITGQTILVDGGLVRSL